LLAKALTEPAAMWVHLDHGDFKARLDLRDHRDHRARRAKLALRAKRAPEAKRASRAKWDRLGRRGSRAKPESKVRKVRKGCQATRVPTLLSNLRRRVAAACLLPR